MDWSTYYRAYASTPPDLHTSLPTEENIGKKQVVPLKQDVEVADIGCGFGGLLVALAPELPDTLLLGMTTPTLARSSFNNLF